MDDQEVKVILTAYMSLVSALADELGLDLEDLNVHMDGDSIDADSLSQYVMHRLSLPGVNITVETE